ncbi:FtsJ-like methyltransferase-domain-containing protein [Lasiosphaeris hirsuta]|uniref:rRNA methyltransferase 2, mitochondrial n=1 Tax=Lasiosphaeris hirsuta TaxID=260670 RepID=A0AA40A342_9PEZI|nr:FtsJ-like methyltransferase-domain-containing protein [Lasiosphaeris hirsuta]
MQASWTRTPTRPLALGLSRLSRPILLQGHLNPLHKPSPLPLRRHSSSNSRWKQRQGADQFARSAKVQGLKSRAAFKLLEMDARHNLFKQGQVVVDLGFAPGSWSQVAVERTKPDGRVVGIDLIPAQPPRGVSTIQGNFLSPRVQAMVKQFLVDIERREAEEREAARPEWDEGEGEGEREGGEEEDGVVLERPSYIDAERSAAAQEGQAHAQGEGERAEGKAEGRSQERKLRLVDVVLSDMMMNTSGISFKDHAGSMDLCKAALAFASDTLKTGGHFVCKFYQGAEDKAFENLLKKMFTKVHREKPESSRSVSTPTPIVSLRHTCLGARLLTSALGITRGLFCCFEEETEHHPGRGGSRFVKQQIAPYYL